MAFILCKVILNENEIRTQPGIRYNHSLCTKCVFIIAVINDTES